MAAEIDRRIARAPVNPQRRCCCVLALLLACAPEGSLGRDALADGSSSGGSTTHAQTTETGATSSSSESSTHATGDHGSSESTTHADSTSTDASSSSTGLASCEPTGSEDACELCLKTHCCENWQVCVADELCSCALDCVQGGGALDACTMTHCMGSTDAFQPELDCAHLQCMAQCPWAA